jgi:hypothetical protein
MLIIQYRAQDILLSQLSEGSIGLNFVLKESIPSKSSKKTPNRPRLIIQEGFLLIKRLELHMEGANEVANFTKKLDIQFKQTKQVHLDNGSGIDDFFINIPEGEYESLSFGIQLADHEDLPAVYLSGVFIDSNDDLIPFSFFAQNIYPRFEMDVDLKGQDPFSANFPINPTIVFEINALKWFDSLTPDDLDHAKREDNDITISPAHNESLYWKIVESIVFGEEISVELR